MKKAVHLRSVSGPEATVVSGAGTHRIFWIDGVQASISGFTITNGYLPSGYGAGVWMTGGVVSNCIITGNSNASYGGGIYSSAGLVTHCRIYGNDGSNGGGMYSAGGRISNCLFEQNAGSLGAGVVLLNDAVGLYDSVLCNNQASGGGGGIYIQESTSMVYNCEVYSNTVTGTRGGGIYVNNCTPHLENIKVFSNRTGSDSGDNFNGGGGIWCSAPNGEKVVIRNALIYNNYSYESGGGIYSYNSSIIENSTIVSNYAAFHSGKNYGGGGGITVYNHSSATNMIRNCIIQFNACAYGADNWQFRQTTGHTTYTNNCMGPGAFRNVFYTLPPASFGGGNFSDDPMFVDRESNDWHLQRGSPCINTGIQQDWMTSAVDIDGQPRLDWLRGIADVGCYEYVPSGTMITIR